MFKLYDLHSKYVSQPKEKTGNLRFPYIARQFNFSTNFETNFKELWHSLRKQIANERYDLQIFHEENHIFYEKLLTPNYVMKTLLKINM